MKQLILCCIGITLLVTSTNAQTTTAKDYIKTGIELYDQGQYQEAITAYEKALELSPDSPDANYEIALTYFALNDLDKAILYCDKVIKSKGSKQVKAQAYANKGNALDMQGKPELAIKEYKNAIKIAPEQHLSYYNLGLTYHNLNRYAEAEEALISSLKINPHHASSHLLLGYTKQAQNQRAQSLLALYNFLLLEPNSKRASDAFQEMQNMHQKGVSKGEGNGMNILVSLPKGGDESFSAAELMLSMQQATNATLKKETEITNEELFVNNTKSFFNILGELQKDKKSFWWIYYVDFFADMSKTENVEAFAYYISQTREGDAVIKWLEENPEKLEKLAEWYEQKQR